MWTEPQCKSTWDGFAVDFARTKSAAFYSSSYVGEIRENRMHTQNFLHKNWSALWILKSAACQFLWQKVHGFLADIPHWVKWGTRNPQANSVIAYIHVDYFWIYRKSRKKPKNTMLPLPMPWCSHGNAFPVPNQPLCIQHNDVSCLHGNAEINHRLLVTWCTRTSGGSGNIGEYSDLFIYFYFRCLTFPQGNPQKKIDTICADLTRLHLWEYVQWMGRN